METNTSKKSTWFRKISHNSLFSLLLPLSSCCLSWLSFFSMPSISISQTDRQRRTGKTPEPSISILTFSPFCITIIYPAYPVWFDRARRMQRWQTSGARVRRYSPVVMKVNKILLVAEMTKWWHWYPKGQRSTSQWRHHILNAALQGRQLDWVTEAFDREAAGWCNCSWYNTFNYYAELNRLKCGGWSGFLFLILHHLFCLLTSNWRLMSDFLSLIWV